MVSISLIIDSVFFVKCVKIYTHLYPPPLLCVILAFLISGYIHGVKLTYTYVRLGLFIKLTSLRQFILGTLGDHLIHDDKSRLLVIVAVCLLSFNVILKFWRLTTLNDNTT